jgi:hypothetical protein
MSPLFFGAHTGGMKWGRVNVKRAVRAKAVPVGAKPDLDGMFGTRFVRELSNDWLSDGESAARTDDEAMVDVESLAVPARQPPPDFSAERVIVVGESP